MCAYMTSDRFRRIAVSLAGVEEREHMGHPDFRVGGKIFATLGYPDHDFGTVMLSPEDQSILVRRYPKAFKPAAGMWGRSGSTSIQLRHAPARAVRLAIEAAWERRARVTKPARTRSNEGSVAAKRRPPAV
jgi:hypothetical protein